MLPLHALRERIAREEEAQERGKQEEEAGKQEEEAEEQQSVGDTLCVGVKGERARERGG